MTLCLHCFVSGHVQGVAFRYYTRDQAQSLGISGWARNLTDGRVEVLACGEARAIEQLSMWLHQGPPSAHVTEVQCEKVEKTQMPDGFSIG
ncbi:MAG: acylphosphatase [Pseudomonadota bacterium]|nr:acylphosphatase [Pseudomonadota bacterium]